MLLWLPLLKIIILSKGLEGGSYFSFLWILIILALFASAYMEEEKPVFYLYSSYPGKWLRAVINTAIQCRSNVEVICFLHLRAIALSWILSFSGVKIRQPISCMKKLGKIFSRKLLFKSVKSHLDFSRNLRNITRVKNDVTISGLYPCDVPVITSF